MKSYYKTLSKNNLLEYLKNKEREFNYIFKSDKSGKSDLYLNNLIYEIRQIKAYLNLI